MDSLVEKRKIFLEKLDKRYKKFERFNKYAGRGFIKKIKKLLISPNIYIPYIFSRFYLFRNYNFVTKLFWGKEIVFSIKDASAAMLHSSGLLLGEYCLSKFFIKNLKENDVFYDIGANYGFYTYLSLEFCREVHSFEPLADVFEKLRYNLTESKNVFLNNTAVSNKSGDMLLYLSISSDVSTINKNTIDITPYRYKDKINVKTLTLDEYLKNHSRPTVVKMDVEGAENMVIDGGKEFFKNNSPIIAMEVWTGDNCKKISMRPVEMLRSLGFQSHYINFDGEIEKIDGDLSEVVRSCGDNFIFLKG